MPFIVFELNSLKFIYFGACLEIQVQKWNAMVMTFVLMVLGFVVLLKGADWLVDGASALAERLHISKLVIGLTVVAFGTSAPEMFVNVYATIKGNTDIAIGNILGSNIANIFLILGVSAAIYPLVIQRNTTWKEIPFSLLAACVLGVMANDMLINGVGPSALTRTDGIMLLSLFTIFMYYIFDMAKQSGPTQEEERVPLTVPKASLFVLLGLVGLVLGGQWIVNGAVTIAEQFNVSQSLIGLTIVAIGTSLPELATSVVAARKKSVDIAVGNVIGSNIFNTFLILGISSLIRPIPFTHKGNFDILMSIMASFLLFNFVYFGKKHVLQRGQGIGFVLIYITYLVVLVVRG